MGSCLQFWQATEESKEKLLKNNQIQFKINCKCNIIVRVIKASHSVKGSHSYSFIPNHKPWKVNRIHYRASHSPLQIQIRSIVNININTPYQKAWKGQNSDKQSK